MTMGDSTKSLQVITNPFSTATLHAKIPDGKCSSSIGVRNASSGEHTIKKSNNYMDYVFYPHIKNPLVIYNSDEADIYYINMKYMPECSRDETTTDLVAFGRQISKFRVVAAGLKLAITNNTDSNDGWFEACRVPVPKDAGGYLWNYKNATRVLRNVPDYNKFGVVPDANNASSTLMAEQKSYVTGKLTDLKKHTFFLKNEQNSYDFNVMDTATKIDGALTQDVVFQPQTTAGFQNILSNSIDFGMDAIVIRIHGTEETKVMYHVVTHVESIVSPTSSLAMFATYNQPQLQGLQRVAHRLAQVRSPSFIEGVRFTSTLPLSRTYPPRRYSYKKRPYRYMMRRTFVAGPSVQLKTGTRKRSSSKKQVRSNRLTNLPTPRRLFH